VSSRTNREKNQEGVIRRRGEFRRVYKKEQKKGAAALERTAALLRLIVIDQSDITLSLLALQQRQDVLRAGIGLSHSKRTGLVQNLHLREVRSFFSKVNVTD